MSESPLEIKDLSIQWKKLVFRESNESSLGILYNGEEFTMV